MSEITNRKKLKVAIPMKKFKTFWFYVFLMIVQIVTANAAKYVQSPVSQPSDQLSGTQQVPFIGAQVIIEHGQTPEEIDTWFRVLKEKSFNRLPYPDV